jgi:hypothetical protein
MQSYHTDDSLDCTVIALPPRDGTALPWRRGEPRANLLNTQARLGMVVVYFLALGACGRAARTWVAQTTTRGAIVFVFCLENVESDSGSLSVLDQVRTTT